MITHLNSRRSLASRRRWRAPRRRAVAGNTRWGCDRQPWRLQASKNRTTFLPFARYLRSLYPLDTRIAAQFQALRYCALDGTDHASREEQARMIRRYLGWRNPHADDEKLPEIVARAKVA
jgi:hypothetical protein